MILLRDRQKSIENRGVGGMHSHMAKAAFETVGKERAVSGDQNAPFLKGGSVPHLTCFRENREVQVLSVAAVSQGPSA